MPRISVFGVGQAAKSKYVTAKSLVNIYCEKRPSGEKSGIVAYRTPGLVTFADFIGTAPPRGGFENNTNNLSYVVVSNAFYEVSGTGTFINRGTLLTFSGRVSMADNGVQVIIVDGTYGYIFNTTTLAFTQITDPGFPANPLTVAYLSRRFLVNYGTSSRFQWCDIDNGLSWPALNFSNAEASPDPIVALWANNGQAVLLGSVTTQYFGDSGTTDTAFTEIKGTATEWGLAATWSVAKYDNSIAMLVKNRMGQVMVAQLNGYLPKKISTPDMDSIINGYAVVNDASAFSYMLGGHPMYQINFPSAGESWLYDGSTSIWTQLKSYNSTRHRAQFGWSFLTYTIVAGYNTGKLYQLTDTEYTDDGDQIEALIISENVTSSDLDRFTISKIRADVEVGLGTTAVEQPQIGLSISRDNGNTYGAEEMRPLGPIGNYGDTVDWNRKGTPRNCVLKWRVTDPVPFTFVNGFLDPQD